MEATIEQAGTYEPVAANGLAEAPPVREADVPYAMGWVRDLPDVRDYTTGSDEVAALLSAVPAGETVCADAPRLEAREDLRPWCSPIEDQRTIGSCTAQAGVGIVEYYQRRAFGKHLDGSRLFVYKATRNLLGLTGDTGAWLRSAMGALCTFGVPPEKYWPYDVSKYDVEPPAFVYALGQAYQAEKFYRLDAGGTDPRTLLDDIKKHLTAGIPSMFETLMKERRAEPGVVDAWLGTHPLEESRVTETRRLVSALDAAQVAQLAVDSPEFQAFQRRLRALPPPPEPAAPPPQP